MMKFSSNDGGAKIPALVFSAAFVFLAAAMSRKINVYDEGLIIVGAMACGSG